MIPPDQVTYRKILGLVVSCTGVVLYLFAYITIEYTKSIQKNMFVDWDVKTVSAADYTVEFRVTPDMYEFFQENYLQEDNPISEIG